MTRQQYLLCVLEEELLEAAHRVSKAQRFGLTECQPKQTFDNITRLVSELNDVIAMLEMTGIDKHPSLGNLEEIKAKKVRVEEFIKYSIACGQMSQ
jgi:hypothetical protein